MPTRKKSGNLSYAPHIYIYMKLQNIQRMYLFPILKYANVLCYVTGLLLNYVPGVGRMQCYNTWSENHIKN